MSTYAYVYENEIKEFKEIDDTLYQSWVTNSNPKKDCYKLVVYSNSPVVNDNEVAESSFQIDGDTVVQIWNVRNKTADELRKTFTAFEFLLRFTQAERVAYRNAAKTDEIVADFMSLAQAAQEINNDHPMTISGMNYLVQQGIITEQRKNEILYL